MPTDFNTSSRSNLDARYNQYRINRYGADTELTQDQIKELYTDAVKDLNAQGYNYDVADFTVDPNTQEIGLTFQGEDNYTATNNANRSNTTTSVSDDDDDFYETPKDIKTTVIDNSTTTGGEEIRTAFDVKESVDTSESQFWQDEVDDLKTDYQDARTKYLADNPGSTGIDWIKSEESRNLSAEIRDAEDSRDAAQINVTKNYDADGNLTGVTESQWDYRTGEYTEISKSEYQTADQVNDKLNRDEFGDDEAELDNVEWSNDDTTVSGVNSAGNPVVDTDFDDDGNIVTTFADGTTQVQDEDGNIISSTTPTQAALDNNLTNSQNNYNNAQNPSNPANSPSVAELRGGNTDKEDWRVRLRLAPQSNYLYNAPDPGIMAPLKATDGIVFPYMPRIDHRHVASYTNHSLPHSNIRSYFYQGSYVDPLVVNATFTSQDTREANYLLASLHFLKSCTKMFYGQDAQRGTPPPLVFLSGLGDYQYNEHPCLVENIQYSLPTDVDYIEAGEPSNLNADFLGPISNSVSNKNPVGDFVSSTISRLFSSGLDFGAKRIIRRDKVSNAGIFGSSIDGKTRVPTKLDISFTLLPVNTRDQVSNEYSLEKYANGSLLKKGFW